MWHFYVLCYLINLVSQRDYLPVTGVQLVGAQREKWQTKN